MLHKIIQNHSTIIKKTIFPALITGLITLAAGYGLGVLEHQRNSEWEKIKIRHEQQLILWQSMAAKFPMYLVTRSRVIKISKGLNEHSKEFQGYSTAEKVEIQRRKERYVAERDSSRLSLMADLEQAKYFFPGSKKSIDCFDQLEKNTAQLDYTQLPDEDTWRRHMNSILDISFKEIKSL